ncbi:hypothetical protein DXG01_010715, partial [Tephrocybe rancida]
EMEARTSPNRPLQEHLKPGRGALIKHGKYWYPVRVIQHVENGWQVKVWRECRFEEPGMVPGSFITVPFDCIIDSLWGKHAERRAIQLGIWTHACEIPDPEDILVDPSSTPYTQEIHIALSPERE